MSIDLTFFEINASDKADASFGRKMMAFSEDHRSGIVPLEILNAMSRVGENLAETPIEKLKLSRVDNMVIKYARRVL